MAKRISLLLVFCFLLFNQTVEAKGEFKTDFKVRFELAQTGKTKISQEVTLTNQLATVYATQYAFTLSVRPEKLIARQNGKSLKTAIKEFEDKTEVTINFEEPILGKEKSFTFVINYELAGIARKNGQIWEVNLPRLDDSEEIDQYLLVLAVPASFGPPAIFKPNLPRESKETGYQLFFFDKEALVKGGISAAFGDFQTFNFALNYHLNNDHEKKAITEIALPPDTVWQKMIYERLEPEPLEVGVDEDGNWLAKYELLAKQKLDVNAVGQVLIFAEPQSDYRQLLTPPGKTNLQEQRFWPVNDPLIKQKVKKLKTVKEIYDFVVKELEYDFTRINKSMVRLGAKEALLRPTKAICMEFTDLFVTLARAGGIPAREIEGYAYTNNSELKPLSLLTDVLHSWPEFWDKDRQLWRPVDPTWEKTTKGVDFFNKTDLNHFAFVIHGQNSERPYPAGAYRESQAGGRDVQVSYGLYHGEISEPEVEVTVLLPPLIIEGKDEKGKIFLRNKGAMAKYNYQLSLKTTDQTENWPIKILPPKAKKTIEVAFRVQTRWQRQAQELVVTADGKNYDRIVVVGSWFDRWFDQIKNFLKR